MPRSLAKTDKERMRTLPRRDNGPPDSSPGSAKSHDRDPRAAQGFVVKEEPARPTESARTPRSPSCPQTAQLPSPSDIEEFPTKTNPSACSVSRPEFARETNTRACPSIARIGKPAWRI